MRFLIAADIVNQPLSNTLARRAGCEQTKPRAQTRELLVLPAFAFSFQPSALSLLLFTIFATTIYMVRRGIFSYISKELLNPMRLLRAAKPTDLRLYIIILRLQRPVHV